MNYSIYHFLADEPNPEMTSFVFKETLMGHILLWGNAYAQIIGDGIILKGKCKKCGEQVARYIESN